MKIVSRLRFDSDCMRTEEIEKSYSNSGNKSYQINIYLYDQGNHDLKRKNMQALNFLQTLFFQYDKIVYVTMVYVRGGDESLEVEIYEHDSKSEYDLARMTFKEKSAFVKKLGRGNWNCNKEDDLEL